MPRQRVPIDVNALLWNQKVQGWRMVFGMPKTLTFQPGKNDSNRRQSSHLHIPGKWQSFSLMILLLRSVDSVTTKPLNIPKINIQTRREWNERVPEQLSSSLNLRTSLIFWMGKLFLAIWTSCLFIRLWTPGPGWSRSGIRWSNRFWIFLNVRPP